MGNKTSKLQEIPKLKSAEIEEFSKQTLFTHEQIEKLYTHFYKISSLETDDGVIDFSEFCLNLHNPPESVLCEGVFHLFDANNDGTINFREFLIGISTFMIPKEDLYIRIPATRLKEQIEVSYRMFSGMRNKIYLKDVKKMMTSAITDNHSINLDNGMIEAIVDRTFSDLECEEDSHGIYIDANSYKKMILKNPEMLKWLSIDIEKATKSIKTFMRKSKARCL
ncbi:unnamed protein product [Blepharisma stoltei]|uniref:EF-hand domain-containing protein n=1 Tax=Blepharisma stoltei TaxID=1481888 RepID=A0AAU9JZI6_9CILI|nr:unnamed protein product [Blepharisma stoltei]